MNNYTSQVNLVLEHLKTHEGITTIEAITLYGVTRLSAVIYILKKKGYPIEGDFIAVLNRFQRRCKVKKYKLIEV